jgi:hypothetical protein
VSFRKILRKAAPRWLRGIRRNCGGYNPDRSLFAGRLTDPQLTAEEWIRLVNALIFPNGVRKSTRINRNSNLLKQLIQAGHLDTLPPEITVLDMGASVGIDASGNLDVLARNRKVSRYVMADLYTELLYETATQRIFDQDGMLLQQALKEGFFAFYFEFKYRIEPLFHWRNLQRTRRMKRKLRGIFPDQKHTITIPLIYPEAKEHPVIQSIRANVFQPIHERYDVILCMNLLQRRYFSDTEIERGNQNLAEALNPGGLLITGVTDAYQLIRYGEYRKPQTEQ